ncbi:hypothetical protein [Paracoccus sp. TOH]|uniref:hypothetical protein n=1 Tax=Paracoccus sp. TOH TaxID=1263728 RepID=UPI0025AF9FC1|nr:hypothetical protein [Paracoccus sp. TOH]WJS83848.1 hypothetical protein NBE95_08725 [Paracoccus sp. TOH]
MTEALLLLDQARRHLIASEADLALEKMQRFEKLLAAGNLPKGGVEACAEALQAIRALAEAAREGITAAKRQIAEITAISRNLDTYDHQGKKLGRLAVPHREKRF